MLLLGVSLFAVLAPGYTPSTAVNEHVSANLSIVLVVGFAYDLIAAALLWVWPAQTHPAFSLGTLALDIVLLGAVYWASAGNTLIFFAAGMFPILVAWTRYGWPGGAASTIAVIAVGVLLFPLTPLGLKSPLDPAIVGAILLGLTSLIIGVVLNRDLIAARYGGSARQSQLQQAAKERTRAIYEMAAILNATLDYNKVLETALEMGNLGLRDAGRDVRLVSAVLLFRDDMLYVATSQRLTRSDRSVVIEGKRGVVGLALRRAEPVFASDPIHDPELRYFAALQPCQSVLIIPLRAGFDTYGVLIFGAPERDAFDDDAVELLTAIGTQATIALQNAVLYRNVMEEKERIVEVEEEARKKLARDLHDGPTQGVAAIAMRLNYIRRLLDRSPEEVADELWKVEELARRTSNEIRHLLFTLRPLVLESQGLVAALQQFSEKMRDTHQQNVIVQIKQGCAEMLDGHAQGVIFGIIEEAVNNARKHAQADHIWVRLYTRPPYFVVEIQDDGVGFDVQEMEKSYESRGSQSLGMVNQRDRAALIDGQFRIESAPGKGTTVRVIIPLDSRHIIPKLTGKPSE